MQIEPIKLDYQTESEISIWLEQYLNDSTGGQEHEKRLTFMVTCFKKYKNLLLTDRGIQY